VRKKSGIGQKNEKNNCQYKTRGTVKRMRVQQRVCTATMTLVQDLEESDGNQVRTLCEEAVLRLDESTHVQGISGSIHKMPAFISHPC
jgi:hypothetical protein